MLICSRSIEFALKLRPMDILLTNLVAEEEFERQTLKIEEMRVNGVDLEEIIVMLIALSCNESIRHYRSTLVENALRQASR